jgi:hypothetical protein
MSDERAAGGERRATRIMAARQTTERLARVIGRRQSRAPSPQVLVTFLACALLCALRSCLASSRAAQSVVCSLSVVPVSLTAAVALTDSAGLSSTLGFSLSPGRARQRNARQRNRPNQYNTILCKTGPVRPIRACAAANSRCRLALPSCRLFVGASGLCPKPAWGPATPATPAPAPAVDRHLAVSHSR